MKIYNQDMQEITREACDLLRGRLEKRTRTVHIDAVQAVEEKGHWVTVAEYPNGGKDVDWVVDIPGVEGIEEHDEIEECQVYIPFTEDELHEREANRIRSQREYMFKRYIDRSPLWYEGLTTEQEAELRTWRQAWLNAPATLVIPTKPEWLK